MNIYNDLDGWLGQLYEDAKEALRRLHSESEIADNLIKHLHSENAELRQENEQLQIEISLLKEENKLLANIYAQRNYGVLDNRQH